MQHDCNCPVCGQPISDIPVTILPERGMVVANGKFTTLTGHEMMLVERLAQKFPNVVSKESLLDWLYQLNTSEEPEIKIIDVFVCKVRKKLTPLGVRIDTAWGKGYSLGVEAKPVIAREEAVE
jgi:DNA-binding response OmpR family regulator